MHVYLPHIGIGNLSLSTYYAIMLVAFCVSTTLALRFNARAEMPLNLDILILPVIMTSALLGARLAYIMLDGLGYQWWHAIRFWDGGYYFHGGLLGGIFGFAAYSRLNGNRLLPSLDFAAPFVVLGESIASVMPHI